MSLLSLVDVNYYVAAVIGIVGNALIIFLLLKANAREIHSYRWLINFQAAIEAVICVLNVLMNYVSFLL